VDRTFAEFLTEILRERGWSPAELARASGLSRQAISNYLNEARRTPDEHALAALAHALGYPPEILYQAAGIPITSTPEMTPDIAAVIQAMSGLPESWQAKLADDARKLREFYERTEAERLEKERLAARKKTGPLPDLP
jgi:transcriptional regulator with XRE-family HTH domain